MYRGHHEWKLRKSIPRNGIRKFHGIYNFFNGGESGFLAIKRKVIGVWRDRDTRFLENQLSQARFTRTTRWFTDDSDNHASVVPEGTCILNHPGGMTFYTRSPLFHWAELVRCKVLITFPREVRPSTAIATLFIAPPTGLNRLKKGARRLEGESCSSGSRGI